MSLPEQLRAIADRLDAAELPAHLRGDGPCADCGTFDNPVWFTDNILWNHVTGESVYAEDAHSAILCPNCFVKRADAVGLEPTGWHISAEWPWRAKATDSAAVQVAAEEQRPGDGVAGRDAILPNGSTMQTWAAKQLPDAFANGTMPPLMLTGGS